MLRKTWEKLVCRNSRRGKEHRGTGARRRRAHPTLEPLEERRALSTIEWGNEGDDNFEIYGANAGLARPS